MVCTSSYLGHRMEVSNEITEHLQAAEQSQLPTTNPRSPIQRALTWILWKEKFHCTADLLFDWFGFNQTSKYITYSA